MNKKLRQAGIAGIILIILALAAVVPATFYRLLGTGVAPYAIFYLISLAAYLGFILGFKIIAEKTNNDLLKKICSAFIILSIIYYGYFILTMFWAGIGSITLLYVLQLVNGAIGLVFGWAILELRKEFSWLGFITGCLMIILSLSIVLSSLFYLLNIFSGFSSFLFGVNNIVLVLVYILETKILFRAEKEL